MEKIIFKFFIIAFTTFSYTFANSEQNNNLKKEPKEVNFTKDTNIKIITSDWVPFSMYNEKNEYEGIAIDFWNLIAKKSNLKSEITENIEDWNKVLAKIKNKEGDMTLDTSFDKNKLHYAIFSKPYISFPIGFATQYHKNFIPESAFLEGLSVAVGKNYSAYVVMKEKFPKINFVQVENTKKALKLLSAGQVDVAIDILPAISHLIYKKGYSNLKIAGTSEEKIELSFMMRKDYKNLKKIIDKQISLITDSEKDEIIRKWVLVKYETKIIDKENLIHISILLAILLLIFIVFYIYKQRNQRELEFLSNTDSLTGLKNRRYIDHILQNQINKKFSVIILDIDHFKQINDTYGHLVGDEVLVEVATLLKGNVNANDIIGRWGGEEFIIICKNTSAMEAQILANRVRTLLENKKFRNCEKITGSFGVSEAQKDLTIKDVLHNADSALYKAKNEGRNKVVAWGKKFN